MIQTPKETEEHQVLTFKLLQSSIVNELIVIDSQENFYCRFIGADYKDDSTMMVEAKKLVDILNQNPPY